MPPGRARSSVGEHCVHTAGVAGSIPAAPTILAMIYADFARILRRVRRYTCAQEAANFLKPTHSVFIWPGTRLSAARRNTSPGKRRPLANTRATPGQYPTRERVSGALIRAGHLYAPCRRRGLEPPHTLLTRAPPPGATPLFSRYGPARKIMGGTAVTRLDYASRSLTFLIIPTF